MNNRYMEILRYLGSSIVACIIGFIIGVSYINGKLSIICEHSGISASDIISSNLLEIAYSNACYFIIDYWIWVILLLFICMLIKRYLDNKQNDNEIKAFIIIFILLCIVYGGVIWAIDHLGNEGIQDHEWLKVLFGILVCIIFVGLWGNDLMLRFKRNNINAQIIKVNKRISVISGSDSSKLKEIEIDRVSYYTKIKTDILLRDLILLHRVYSLKGKSENQEIFKKCKDIIYRINAVINLINIEEDLSCNTELEDINKELRKQSGEKRINSDNNIRKIFERKIGKTIITISRIRNINNNGKDMSGTSKNILIMIWYALSNNILSRYILILFILIGATCTLGQFKAIQIIEEDEKYIGSVQLVFKEGDIENAVIINNSNNSILYYDINEGIVKEVEKLNGVYNIELIKYNRGDSDLKDGK